ncbi:glycosyltransferase family 2 protein [Flavobacterium sp. ov086]|uniref:glycosyltransferase family 2 protein n=1 Tax=Flavobacterium sp. ov086 TaxID=1761785 RepID=UPI000B6AFA49|nr:glycosyltransferase family 2 protein [Flavobacterium sp. ov086]SNR49456.1 Glycosyltransferase involved in cell wall bisynthesis [Flavobacterium sp. ov086]
MVSVCIATYNGEKYIKEQINSILVQLKLEDEIVVSDDGSSDNTLKIIKEFEDPRILIVKNYSKKGVNHNFQNALKNAKGDYVFLADQDDVWLPNKVETCVNELKTYDLVVSNCIVTDDSNNIVQNSYFQVAKSGKGFFKNFYRSSYLGCCLAFRKEILKEILPMPENLLLFHDWWFGFISELCYKVKFIETPCMYYRRHNETNSNTLSQSHLSLYQKLEYRFQLLYYGLIRVLIIKTQK